MRIIKPTYINKLAICTSTAVIVALAFFFISGNVWFPQGQAIASNVNSNCNSNSGCSAGGFDDPDAKMKDFRENQ